MPSVAQNNRTYGLELRITVLEEVKRQVELGEEVTERTLANAIQLMSGMPKRSLRHRIGNAVRSLTRSGRLQRTRKETTGDTIAAYYYAITLPEPNTP